MTALILLMGSLSVPLMFVNLFSGIVAGIWLAILGHWNAILWGITGMFVSHFALGFALLPALIFSTPAAYFAERFRALFYFLGFLASLYTVAVITIWCAYVLAFFLSKADTYISAIPLLFWSYGVATGPLGYMASKEGPGLNGSLIATFFAQVGYILMLALLLGFSIRVPEVIFLFFCVMLVGVIFQFMAAMAVFREAQSAGATVV